ncbi:hypothetical protein [Bradyrhizobium sp. USDA 4451]
MAIGKALQLPPTACHDRNRLCLRSVCQHLLDRHNRRASGVGPRLANRSEAQNEAVEIVRIISRGIVGKDIDTLHADRLQRVFNVSELYVVALHRILGAFAGIMTRRKRIAGACKGDDGDAIEQGGVRVGLGDVCQKVLSAWIRSAAPLGAKVYRALVLEVSRKYRTHRTAVDTACIDHCDGKSRIVARGDTNDSTLELAIFHTRFGALQTDCRETTGSSIWP